MSGQIRLPAVAGLFYPAEPEGLAATVDSLLAAAHGATGGAPHAIVVPHAGYAYSGPVAAVAYSAVVPRAAGIRQAVLLGPPHYIPLEGAAVSAADAWATPLGVVPVARDLRDAAFRAGADPADLPHAPEHSLEVQLPFLQRVLRHGFSVLPVVVGDMHTDAVADLVAALWGGDDTLVVVSTDLSHYLDDTAARKLDRATSEAITGLRPEAIADEGACGSRALRGLVEHARRASLTIERLALATSADTAGDRSRVVGYGAFAVAA